MWNSVVYCRVLNGAVFYIVWNTAGSIEFGIVKFSKECGTVQFLLSVN